ncbi:zinc finger protein 501-like [Ornithodoros turicata]|uniref:zinc finger protein 501-like n=1 Tax=Ornithodoros turicata TaxID=34597 RepID=UPI00313A2A3C
MLNIHFPDALCNHHQDGHVPGGTITAEPQLDNTSLVTTNSRTTEQPPDQSNPCALAYTSKESLKHHLLAQCHNESEMCPATPSDAQMGEEGFEFGQRGSFQQHKRTHTCEKPYKCHSCPAEFSQNGLLQRDKRTHTGKKPHKCDVCPAKFSRSATLQQHKRAHTGEKPHKCNVCSAEFGRSDSLLDHKRTHTGEKPYKCDACPAEFSESRSLQQHKRGHTGEKPFKYEVCPTKFSKRVTLQQHKRTHTGEKSHKCNVCRAKFRKSRTLKRHKLTHMGEKPYKCNLCPAEFSQGGNLQQHKRIHTGEKPYKCLPGGVQQKVQPEQTPDKTDRLEAVQEHSLFCKVEVLPNLEHYKWTYVGVKPYKCNLCYAEISHGTNRRQPDDRIAAG